MRTSFVTTLVLGMLTTACARTTFDGWADDDTDTDTDDTDTDTDVTDTDTDVTDTDTDVTDTDDTDTDTDTDTDDTVFQIQRAPGVSDPIAEGSEVRVEGVVITGFGHNSGGEVVGMWVQELESAPYAGVYVYLTNMATTDCLHVGDLVTVEGDSDEYNGVTEIIATEDADSICDGASPGGGGQVRIMGTATVPAPIHLTSDALGLDSDAPMEPYEGVLVQVEQVAVTIGANEYGEFWVANVDVSDGDLMVDDKAWLESEAMPVVQEGDTFESIVGVVDYTFGDHKIEPRTHADLVGYTLASD